MVAAMNTVGMKAAGSSCELAQCTHRLQLPFGSRLQARKGVVSRSALRQASHGIRLLSTRSAPNQQHLFEALEALRRVALGAVLSTVDFLDYARAHRPPSQALPKPRMFPLHPAHSPTELSLGVLFATAVSVAHMFMLGVALLGSLLVDVLDYARDYRDV